MDYKIKALEDIEYIRLRKEFYIGPAYNPDQLAFEILDNSVDEAINQFASKITIDIDQNEHEVTITDNGRGIPIHKMILYGQPSDSVIVACCKLNSGGKFDDKAYKYSIGMHGVGLVAVNALSLEMTVCIVKDGIINVYQFKDSQFVNLEKIPLKDQPVDWKTFVSFKIDPKFFNNPIFTLEKFQQKIKLIKSKHPNLEIVLNGKKEKPISRLDYVNQLFGENIEKNKIIHIEKGGKDFEIDLYFTYGSGNLIVGDVNLHNCEGTYLTNFTTTYFNAVNGIVSTQLTKSEVLSNFKAYISLYVKGLQFDNQTKTKLTLNVGHIIDKISQDIKNAVAYNKYFQSIFETIIQNKKQKKLARNIGISQKRVSNENPLKDCLVIPGDVLYIVEGESAGGTLKDFINNRTEAILPISGKILNAVKSDIEVVADSKKFKYLLEAIGVSFKTSTSFRYKKIKILTDADSDGGHITVLLLMALLTFAKQLITERRVSLILPPLYGTTVNNKFIPIFDKSEIGNYKNVNRFKGLGEMNSNQLEVIVRGNYEYIINPPTNKTQEEGIIKCVTETLVKRKLCSKSDMFNVNKLYDMIRLTQM